MARRFGHPDVAGNNGIVNPIPEEIPRIGRDLGRKISADDVVETTRRHLLDRLPADTPPPQARAAKACATAS